MLENGRSCNYSPTKSYIYNQQKRSIEPKKKFHEKFF